MTNNIELIRGFPQPDSRQQRFQRGHPFGGGVQGDNANNLRFFSIYPANNINKSNKENDAQKQVESLCKKRIDKTKMPTKS
ncbi:MAG: hypothetical protein J6B75_00445, partial [Ruminococcus sp.]|nr:hypothetical protein [Ruminococcus sp.]